MMLAQHPVSRLEQPTSVPSPDCRGDPPRSVLNELMKSTCDVWSRANSPELRNRREDNDFVSIGRD